MMRLARLCLLAAIAAALASSAEVYTYWIEPCSEDLAAQSGCQPGDPELARWALEAWQRAAGREVQFVAADGQVDARIHFYWLGGKPQLYGEAHVVFLNGKRVWVVDVQPDLSQFGDRIGAASRTDKLFRDTVVYLTCVHELGHVLALSHSDDFSDIMYSFQYGGNVLEYFNRYRRMLKERRDIRAHSGISDLDAKRVATLYAGR